MKNDSLKIIVDVGVGTIIKNWLMNQNFNILSIRLLNPEMTDDAIIALTLQEEALIISMDKDFGELVFKRNNKHWGILLLRLEDAVAEEKLAVIQNIFPEHIEAIKNNFAVYQNGKLRIRNSSL